jgi:hypothetical protein
MTDQTRCASCGKFIAERDMGTRGRARCEYTPLSDLTVESIEWTCPACVDAIDTMSGRDRP